MIHFVWKSQGKWILQSSRNRGCRRRPTDRAVPRHRRGLVVYVDHVVYADSSCLCRLKLAVGWLVNRKQAVPADMLWESAIDYLLNNLWQKTEVADRPIGRLVIEVHGALLQQWSDNCALTAAWKCELLEWCVAHCSNDWHQDITGTLDIAKQCDFRFGIFFSF